MNGVVAFRGAATLPVGGGDARAVRAPGPRGPHARPPLLVLQVRARARRGRPRARGIWLPVLVPAVPEPRPPAGDRAPRRRPRSSSGVLALRACAPRPHAPEPPTSSSSSASSGSPARSSRALCCRTSSSAGGSATGSSSAGSSLVGAPVALRPRRGSPSRPLAGDLRAAELVAAEEASSARTCAPDGRLAAEGHYTEHHTRRVALLAVQVGEELGLSARRLRHLAIGGLLHDIGKLGVPDAILKKPGPLDDDEFDGRQAAPRARHETARRARRLRRQASAASCATTTSGWTARGYPRRAARRDESSSTRGSSPSATSTTRSSRRASTGRRGRTSRRSALLREQIGTAFDPRCVRRSSGWSSGSGSPSPSQPQSEAPPSGRNRADGVA